MTRASVTLSKHASSCRTTARFPSYSPISPADEANGTEASFTLTTPSGSTRATLTSLPSGRFLISISVVLRRPSASSIRFWILRQTTLTPSSRKEQLHKQRAIYHVPRRSLLRCIRRPTTRLQSKNKLIRRFWNVALHQLFQGSRKSLHNRIPL